MARQLVTTLLGNDLRELVDAVPHRQAQRHGSTTADVQTAPSAQQTSHELDASISDSALEAELDAIHQTFSDEPADLS